MIVSCKERLAEPQRGSHPRRSFRQSDRLWSVRRRQVGSVVCESTSSDIPSMYHRYADAWGNEMSGYTTGEWTSTWASRDGWGHNTKEYDGDSGLVYMYQRWYQPELGVFMSQAPYPPMAENQYSFAMQMPVHNYDSRGEYSACECELEWEQCNRRCRRIRRGKPGYTTDLLKALCWEACNIEYGACLAASRESMTIIGEVIIIAGVAYIVVQLAGGMIVLIPVGV